MSSLPPFDKQSLPIRVYKWARSRWTRFRQWVRLEPRKAVLFGVLISVLFISLAFGQFFKMRSNERGDELASYPSMTVKSLQDAINKDKVKSLTNSSALVGSWLGQQYHFYIVVKLKDGKTLAVEQIDPSRQEQWKSLTQDATTHNFEILQGYNAFEEIPVMGIISFSMLILFLILGLVAAQMVMGEALSGFKFKPDRPDSLAKMSDVIGYDEVKREFSEVLDQLRHAERYEEQGIRAARGILLTGDPGVGKTMLAKAVAEQMNAEFFTCTGADFVEMYVGVGPKRVRALFHQARRTKNAVIFIDEIDALGSRDQAHQDSERQATINRMLAELDGMNGNSNMLVIGATNFPDRLDKALRRPGRFDKIIHMPLPDVKTRQGILDKYLEKAPRAQDVNTETLALRTQAYSGAQLRQLVDEAKNLALRESRLEKREYILTQEYLERGQEIAIMGIFERESKGPEARRAAIHELGHALAGHLLCPFQKVEKVTLRGRGDALAYMFSRPLEERMMQTNEDLRGHIATMLGGRAAEDVILGSISSGAHNDLKRANELAEQMVCSFGMGKTFGLRTFVPTQLTSEFPKVVEEDIVNIIAEEYKRACDLVEKHKEWLLAKTDLLFVRKVLGHDALFDDLPLLAS